ncbi:MAG: hypothetical protein U0Y68_09715 [Blastocatellia bacterium]
MEINRFNGGAISTKVNTAHADARDDAPEAATEGRDFASVLEKAAPPAPQRQEREHEQPSTQPQAQATEQAKPQHDQEQDDAEQQSNAGASALRWQGNAAAPIEALELPAILPKPDLEALLASVRTQMLPGGEREVTLALPHSVLSGLRVQLLATPTGRITANFLTNNSEVKALLDGRAHELAELLRTRGVNLVAVKTSFEAAPQQQNQSQQQPRFRRASSEVQVEEVAHDLASTRELHADDVAPENTAALWRI